MGKQELSGYSFPRFPERWGDTERQFALGLRRLFDTIFGEQVNISKEITQNENTLSEAISKVEKEFGEKIDRIADDINIRLGDINTRLGDINTRLDGINSWQNDVDGTLHNMDLLIDGVVDTLIDLRSDMRSVESRLDGVPDLIYPIGITVFTQDGVNAPFTFGTWEVMTDPSTLTPVQDAYGNYMWKRVADRS